MYEKMGKSPIYRWFSDGFPLPAAPGRHLGRRAFSPLASHSAIAPGSMKLRKSSECWSGFWIIVMIPASCWIIWWCSNHFKVIWLDVCEWCGDLMMSGSSLEGNPTTVISSRISSSNPKAQSFAFKGCDFSRMLDFFRPTSAPDPNDPDNHTATWLHWSFLHPKSALRFFKHICNAQTFRAKNHGFSQRVPFKPSIHL